MLGAGVQRDANEPEIVDGLKKVGCLVAPVSGAGVPDLLVWSPFQKRILLLEVKDGAKKKSARRLKPAQVVFRADWLGAGAPVFVVTSLAEALVVVGAMKRTRKVSVK